jgi:hypothetical protein
MPALYFRIIKIANADAVKQCLDQTHQKLMRHETHLANLMSFATHKLVQQLAAGEPVRKIHQEPPTCITTVLAIAAAESNQPSASAEVKALEYRTFQLGSCDVAALCSMHQCAVCLG